MTQSRFLRFFMFSLLSLVLVYSSQNLFAGEDVEIANGPGGYMTFPHSATDEMRLPALLLIHTWRGLDAQTRTIADNFADHGFITLAVDLYHGRLARDDSEAYELRGRLSEKMTLRDLQSSLQFLKEHNRVNPKRIGVLGLSMGSKWGLELALTRPDDVRALGVFFLDIELHNSGLSELAAPLLGIFAAEDKTNTIDDVDDFDFRLFQLDKRPDIFVYPKTKKGFAFVSHEHYDPRASGDAWKKTLIFFKRNLVYT